MADETHVGEFLLINNNNTRTKFALADDDRLLRHRVIDSCDVSVSAVQNLLEGWDFEKAVLASVVPANAPDLIASVADKEIVEVSCRINLPVEIDFPNPTTVGADRIANAAAVAGEYGGEAVIVVDFGTAVTFDIVDARPAYIGGVIAPGLDSMRNYLHQRTALLPIIDLKRPDFAIGKSTEDAMLSGAFHGYRGLVKEIIAQIEKELGQKAKIVATGGYADLIAEGLSEIEEIEPKLTMLGLLKIARMNFSHE